MMKRRHWKLSLLAAASLAVVVGVPAIRGAPFTLPLLVEFTWTDGHPNLHIWDHGCNWGGFGCPATGPDDAGDNATFPTNGGTAWVVDATTETIGDLTIEESVDFTGDSGSVPDLTVATLTIDATAAAVTVTFNDDMDLTAN